MVDTPGAPTTEASDAAAEAAAAADAAKANATDAAAAAASADTAAATGVVGGAAGWLNAHSRSHLVRSLGSQTLDVLLCVMDGGGERPRVVSRHYSP